MNSRQVIIVITVFAVAISGYSIFKIYSDNAREIRIAEIRAEEMKIILQIFQFENEKDKQKTQIFTDLMRAK